MLQRTAFGAGTGILLDTTLFGRVAVREPLTLRIGYANDDLVRNILRYVGEERLNLAVERPAAICSITGQPTAASLTAESAPAKPAAKK